MNLTFTTDELLAGLAIGMAIGMATGKFQNFQMVSNREFQVQLGK